MTPPTIRAARDEDLPAMQPLFRALDELHAHLAPGFFQLAPGLPRLPRTLLQALRSADDALFVAQDDTDDGALVGIATARIYATPPAPSMTPLRRAHLEDLYVVPAARRRGCGRSLLERVAAWARERDAAQLLLTVWSGNAEAAAFYARLGFVTVNSVLSQDLEAVRGPF